MQASFSSAKILEAFFAPRKIPQNLMRKSNRSIGKGTRRSVKDCQVQRPAQPRRRGASWLVLSTAMAFMLPQAVRAVELSWDPDGIPGNNVPLTQAGLGGAGVWDTTTPQWWNGTSTLPWVNASKDTAVFGGITGGTVTFAAPAVVGGITFNTGGYTIIPDGTNTLTLDNGASKAIIRTNADGLIGLNANTFALKGTNGFIKEGGGTLTLRGRNEDFTGGVIVKQGTLNLSGETRALGTTSRSEITLEGGNLSLQFDQGDDFTVASFGNLLNVTRSATISVDRITGNQSDGKVDLSFLNIGAQTLTVTSASNYGLRFLGQTNLKSALSTFSTTLNPVGYDFAGARAISLVGQIVGTGALNKVGTGTLWVGQIPAGALSPNRSTYSGGTNVLQGTVGAAWDNLDPWSSSNFGSGRVIVSPGASLRVWGNANLDGVSGAPRTNGLLLGSTANALSSLIWDGVAEDLGGGTSVIQQAYVGSYGTSAQIGIEVGSAPFAYANIGAHKPDGTQIDGAGWTFMGAIATPSGGPTMYAPIPSAQLDPAIVDDNGVLKRYYLLGGNNTNASSTILQIGKWGSGEILKPGADAVIIGSPLGAVQSSVANGTGWVRFVDFNSIGNTPIIVNKLSTLSFEAATDFTGPGNPGPFGTGSLYIYGTFVAAGASGEGITANTVYNAMSGGTIDLNYNNRNSNTGPSTSSPQIIPQNSTLNLHSGTFIHRASNLSKDYTNETAVAAVNIRGGSTINIQRGNAGGSNSWALSRVSIGNLNRFDFGTVNFAMATPNSRMGAETVANDGIDQQVFLGGTSDPGQPKYLEVAPLALGEAGEDPVSRPSMVAPWMIDSTNNTFMTYVNGAGLVSLVPGTRATTQYGGIYNGQPTFRDWGNGNYSRLAATEAEFLLSTSQDILDVSTGTINVTGAVGALAARFGGNVVMNGTSTITIGGASADANFPGGVIFLTTGTDRTHTPNWVFGATPKEGIIYVSGSNIITLSGSVTANNLTKSGAGQLSLTGTNTNLNGTLTLNQGTLRGTPAGLNSRPISLWGGSLNLSTTANGGYNNAITVYGDAAIAPGGSNQARLGTLTIASRNIGGVSGADAPVVLTISDGGLAVGNTTLSGPLNLVHNGNMPLLVTGAVSGENHLHKWGLGTMSLTQQSTYTGNTTINAGVLFSQSAAAPTRNLSNVVTAGVFGTTGTITINPGGVLRLAGPGVLGSGTGQKTIKVNSDMSGVAVIALAYNGNATLPTGNFVYNYTNLGNTAHAGGAAGAPFSVVYAIDAVGYSGTIDQNASAVMRASSLGSTMGGTFTGSIIPNANTNTYRLGGGAGQTLSPNMTPLLTMAGTENQLTNGAGNVKRYVQIGLLNNVLQANSTLMTNGGSSTNGGVQIVNRNNYTGDTIVNGNLAISNAYGILSLGNSDAIGTGSLIFNGGAVQAQVNTGLPTLTPAIRITKNAVSFLGDAVFSGSTDLFIDTTVSLGNNKSITGATNLVDNLDGVNRVLSVINTTGRITITGNIIDGADSAGGNGITKSGTGTLVLTGTGNSYTGYTNLNQGVLVVPTDTTIPNASQINFNGGSLGIWDSSFTTNRYYIFQGSGSFDVGPGQTLTQSALSQFSGPGTVIKTGQGTLVLNGDNAHSNANAFTISNGILQISRDKNLGDTNAKGQIVLGGGALRVSSSFETARNLTTGSNLNGAIDVPTGVTFSVSGGINSAGTGIMTKTGEGTLYTTANNAVSNLVIANGTFKSSSNLPFQVGSTQSVQYVNGSNRLIGLVNTDNLAIGMPVFGPGIPNGAVITAFIAPDEVQISATTTAASNNGNNVSVSVIFGGPAILQTTGSTSGTNKKQLTMASTSGLFVGMLVGGPHIPVGSVITSIDSATQVTIDKDTVQASTNVQFSFLNRVSDTLAGGTLLLSQTNTDITVGGRRNLDINYSGGGHVKMENGPANSVELQIFNFDRLSQGTLVIEPTTKFLGGAGADGARITLENGYLGNFNKATFNTNGILAPSMIMADQSGNGNFVTYVDNATGIATYAGPTIGTLAGLQPTAIANITTPQNIAGTASVYAVRTNSNISGGNLVIPSITNTNQGAILANENLEISSNLFFDPNAASGGTADSGEGLIYVRGGKTATLSGQVTVNDLTKFGPGTLLISGNTRANSFIVHEGILKMTPAGNATAGFSELYLNNQGMLDLDGQSLKVTGLGNTPAVLNTSPALAGGWVGNSSTTGDATLQVNSQGGVTTTFLGQIVDTLPGSGGTHKTSLVKTGDGTLVLGGFSASNPDSGNNTFTGGVTVYRGSLQVQGIYALGGANGTTAGAVNLIGGTLDLQNNGAGVNGTISLGNKLTVNVRGPGVINVTRPSANSGNAWLIGDLNLTKNTLAVSGGNSYRLRVDGTTTILGNYGSIATNNDGPSGTVELAGQIVGSGALNKLNGTNQRTLIISGTNNTYSGGTNIVGGTVYVTGNSGTPLGTGPVNVFPGSSLRVSGNNALGGAELNVISKFNSLGAVILDSSFNPTFLNTTNFTSAYGVTLQLGTPFFNQPLDMSTIGDGTAFLGSGLTSAGSYVETAYVAPTLTPGVGDGVSARVYRLTGGSVSFAIAGVDGLLKDVSGSVKSFVQFGSPLANVGNAITLGQGTITIRNSNSYTDGSQIAKGTTVVLDVGASPNGSTPLGTGVVEIFGTLATGVAQTQGTLTTPLMVGYSGVGSFFNAPTAGANAGNNANVYLLRPGGTILIRDVAGTVPGNQGRWADGLGSNEKNGALTLNGGTFRLEGAVNYASTEAVGDFTATKGGTLAVVRSTTNGTAELTLKSLTRQDQGTVALVTSAAGTLGNPGDLGAGITGTSPLAYDRIKVTNTTNLLNSTAALNQTGSTFQLVRPWVVDSMTHNYVAHNTASGFQPLGTYAGTAAAGFVGYSATQTVSGTLDLPTMTGGNATAQWINGAANGTLTLTGSTSVNALRLSTGNTALTSTRTFTINKGSVANSDTVVIEGGGLLFHNLTPGADNITSTILVQANLRFGSLAGNAQEGIIYVSNANAGTNRNAVNQINGQITASSLTKFGAGQLMISSVNPNLFGGITINSGNLLLQTTVNDRYTGGGEIWGAANRQAITLNGGQLILDGFVGNDKTSVLPSTYRASANLGSNVTFAADATMSNNSNTTMQWINNLTLASISARTPVVATISNGITVGGTTTLAGVNNIFNITFVNAPSVVLAGKVSGGLLTKYGNATLLVSSGLNDYAGTIINAADVNTATSIVGSLTRTGTPFGSGKPITVNPGALLRIADPSNIATNAVTLNSDGQGLAGISLAYNGAIPQILTTGNATNGTIVVKSTSDYSGVLGLDTNNFSTYIDMSQVADGKMWLGTSINPSQNNTTNFNSGSVNYFQQTLGPAAGNVYRLGGGGNQGSLAFGAAVFENVFTGNVSLEIGANTANSNVGGPSYINGNIGNITLSNRNNFSGGVTLNPSANLQLTNAYALGSGPIRANGGGIVLQNNITVPNDIEFLGDNLTTPGSTGTDASLTGTINLSPNGVGTTGTLNFGGNGVVGIHGNIISGTGNATGNLIKTAAQTVILSGLSTYTGSTAATSGLLVASRNVMPNQPGPFGVSEVPVVMNGGSIGLGGEIEIGRDITVGTSGSIRGMTLGTAVVSGSISVNASNTATLDQVAPAQFQGGVLEIRGPITGTGAVNIGLSDTDGTATTGTSNYGIVRLSGETSGYGSSIFTGTLTLNAGRLQIASDTLYSTTSPNVVSAVIRGPLGTGSLLFGQGNNNSGGIIEAYGANRVIANPLAAISSTSTTTATFAGHHDLTFLQGLNLNSDGSNRTRIFNVTSNGLVTFAGALSSNLVTFQKIGNGTLVLTGTNIQRSSTQQTLDIQAGVVSVSRNENLGLAKNGTDNTDLRLGGGTLQTTASFTTERDIILGANSGIDVTSGTLTSTSAVTGAFALTKTGPGTLALNGGASALTSLTIGGMPLASAAGLSGGQSGGTVSTTLTTTAAGSLSPFGNSITINGGTLALLGSATASNPNPPTPTSFAQNLTVATLNYGGGAYISLAKNAGDQTQLQITTLARAANTDGTLVITPSVLANLGSTEKLIGFGTTVIDLTPGIYVRLPGAGQDASFARNTATGLQFLNGSATNLTFGGESNVANLTTETTVGGGTPNATVIIRGVRTTANIVPNGNSLLRITTGGLILNGGAGVNVSSKLAFVAPSTFVPAEALVYVRDSQTTPSSITGGFSSTNFTKSGPGILVIGGTDNVMTLATGQTGLQRMTVNEGSIRFASQASVPNGGQINVVVYDTGTLDLNGSALSIGGLSGTGRVTTTGTAELTIDARNNGTPAVFNGVLGGAGLSLKKIGNGTLILGDGSTYGGGTIVGAGSVTNAIPTSLNLAAAGILQINAFDSLGSGPVSLEGGTLQLSLTQAGNESDEGQTVVQLGKGDGLNFVVPATTSFGGPNLSSAITWVGTTAYQAINNLTINAPQLSFGVGATNTDFGFMVRGQTTLAGDTQLYSGGTATRLTFLTGKINAAGSSLIKTGPGTLVVTNTDTGTGANNVGRWNVTQGALQFRLSKGGSNPLTNSTTAQINGGTLSIRHDGDGLADPESLTTFASNDIQVGSTIPLSATNYEASAVSTLELTTNLAANHKTVVFNQLKFGGPQGAAFFSQTGTTTANYTSEFAGGLTMVNNAYLNLNTNTLLFNLTLGGTITGNGTLFKQGNSELDVNTTSATSSGGTVLAGGNTFFAAFRGNTRTLNPTAKLPGNITVQPGASLRFTGTGNVNTNNWVDVRSSLSSLAVIGIGENAPISAYNLRTPTSGGVQIYGDLTADNSGSGVLALNTTYTNVIDLARIGDGGFYLGSTNDGSGSGQGNSLHGSYNAATLGVGRGNIYRLGGGINSLGPVLYFGTNGTSNALTGTASVMVGAPLTNGSIGTPTNGIGTVVLTTAQNYTGSTTVNRGSHLEFRGSLATSGFDVFGTLTAGGRDGYFNPSIVNQPVNLRVGSTLSLDNSFDLTAVSNSHGRWGDVTELTLNGATLRAIGSAAADLREYMGDITVQGMGTITTQRMFTGRYMELRPNRIIQGVNVDGIQGNKGMVSIEGTNTTQLGIDERVTVTNNVPQVTYGMVAPWMYNNRDMQFLTYGTFGFVNAAYDRVVTAGGTQALNSGSESDRLLLQTAGISLPDGGTLTTYALRADAGIGKVTPANTTAKVIIGSGGLLSNASATLTPALIFGSQAVPVDAVIANASGTTLTIGETAQPTASGQITATNIIKGGDGTLQLDAQQQSFTGSISVNRGSLTLRHANAGGTGGDGNPANGGNIILNGFGSTLNLRNDSATTFTNHLVIGRDNPAATVSAQRISANSGLSLSVRSLTFLGSPGEQGQTLSASTADSFIFRVAGTTNLGASGRVVFNVTGGTLQLEGAVSGGANIVKTGGGTLFLGSTSVPVANTFNNGITIVAGEVRGSASGTSGTSAGTETLVTNNAFGSNTIVMNGGTLSPRADQGNDSTFRVARFDNDVVVNGATSHLYSPSGTTAAVSTSQATINVDRLTGSGGTNKAIAFRSLTIGNQTLQTIQTIGGTATSSFAQFNTVNLLGTPTFNVVTADLILNNISDGGADHGLIKYGQGGLWVKGGATYTGDTVINQGSLRFGSNYTDAAWASVKLASDNIYINPGGAIRLRGTGNIGAGQNLELRSVPGMMAVVTTVTDFNPASVVSANSSGIHGLEVNTATALNQSALGNGTFFLAASAASDSAGTLANPIDYTANTLGAGANNTYRLGGLNQPLRLLPGTDTSTVLTGANKVVIGSLASNGAGTVTLNKTNNYSAGTTVSRGSTVILNSGGTDTPLGSGAVDVFGTLNAAGASGALIAGATTNNNTVTLHPGALLRFDNTSGSTNRWGDTTAVDLNGASIRFDGHSGGTTETIGAITIQKGARIGLNSAGNPLTILSAASLARTAGSTLVITNSAADRLGTTGNNGEQLKLTNSISNATGTNMVPGYIIAGTDNRFVSFNGTNGFTLVADGSMISTNTDLNAAALGATVIGNNTAATTMRADATVFALRTNNNINVTAGSGVTPTLTFAEAGAGNDMGALLAFGASTITPNLKFGVNGNREALIYVGNTGTTTGTSFSAQTLIIRGDITAGTITKFGPGTLQIDKDQNSAARAVGYAGGWTINEGTVTLNTFGGLGNSVPGNTVVLNGSQSGAPTLRFNANSGNTVNQTYTSGPITVVDNAIISFDPGADDRTATIADLEIQSTGGSLQQALLRVDNNRYRSILQAGKLTISGTDANAILQVNATATPDYVPGTAFNNGFSSGVSVASLTGGATHTLTKWGTGMLYVRGSSASTFFGKVSIEQGGLQVLHPQALGSAPQVTVKRTGVFDIGVAGYQHVPTYEKEAVERWSVDGSRSGGISIDLGSATLQIGNDQTATAGNGAEIVLNGGSIEGFLRADDALVRGSNNTNQAVVYRTVSSAYTFKLDGDSFVGQNLENTVNNTTSGVRPNESSPLTGAASGTLLELKGSISGTGALIKRGFDTVVLSGANTYSGGTIVREGILRMGANNVMPAARELNTRGSGQFDLNGYNQTVGKLTSAGSGSQQVNNNSGFITNSSTAVATLTVGNGVTENTSYGGVIQNNVGLTKVGTGQLTLTNAHTYAGPTNINQGALRIESGASLSGTSTVTVAAGTSLINNGSITGGTTSVAGNLSGTGTIAANVSIQNGGTLSAGDNGIGTLTIASSTLTLGTGSEVYFQLGATDGASDRIRLTGANSMLSFQGNWELHISSNGDFNPTGRKFVLFDGDPLAAPIGVNFGNYTIVDDGTLTAGVAWQFESASLYWDSLNNDVIMLNVVPEPGTWSMLAASLGMAVGLQRFRRRRK